MEDNEIDKPLSSGRQGVYQACDLCRRVLAYARGECQDYCVGESRARCSRLTKNSRQLEFVGRAVEENSFFRNLPKMSLRRGEQFRKLGSSLFDSLKGHPKFGVGSRKQSYNRACSWLRDGKRAGEKAEQE